MLDGIHVAYGTENLFPKYHSKEAYLPPEVLRKLIFHQRFYFKYWHLTFLNPCKTATLLSDKMCLIFLQQDQQMMYNSIAKWEGDNSLL